MSESHAAAPAPEDTDKAPAPSTATEGRYVSYSGGSQGWIDNSGVLKSERANTYRFFSVLDAELVRARQSQRKGNKANKRRSVRYELDPDPQVNLKWATLHKRGACKDLSDHGMRVQIVNEDLPLRKGDKVVCEILGKGGENTLLELPCMVMKAEKTGKLRTVWSFGMAFPALAPEQQAILADLIGSVEEQTSGTPSVTP